MHTNDYTQTHTHRETPTSTHKQTWNSPHSLSAEELTMRPTW
jgi:hypothetical protein